MKRILVLTVALAVTGIGSAMIYREAAREHDYRALVARGDTALRGDQTFAAVEAYTGALVTRPDSMLAYLRRAETYRRRGDLQSAVHDFRKAALLDPGATRPLEELGDVLYALRRFDRAADSFEACLRLDDRSALVSYKLALARYRQGNIDGALAAAAQAIRLDDRLAEAHYVIGLCLREKRRTADAQEAFEKAVTLSPGLIAAREELADLSAAHSRRADELEQLQVIAGLDRDRVERQVAVGLAHARAGHSDLAILTLRSALERTPDQPAIYAALGEVWLDDAVARGDRVALGKALEALQRVALSPDADSHVLALYGRALLRDGQIDGAEQVLRTATTRYPVDPQSLALYAAAAEPLNHLEAARQALIGYDVLVADEAQDAQRAGHIASLSVRLRDDESALEWFRRAVTAAPSDLKLLSSLVETEIRVGSHEDARAHIARGLEKEPGNATLLALARRLRTGT